MSIAAQLNRQSLIAQRSQAELDLLRNSSAERSLASSKNKDLSSVARAEARLQNERLQAQTKRDIANAQLKNKKNRKLDTFA